MIYGRKLSPSLAFLNIFSMTTSALEPRVMTVIYTITISEINMQRSLRIRMTTSYISGEYRPCSCHSLAATSTMLLLLLLIIIIMIMIMIMMSILTHSLLPTLSIHILLTFHLPSPCPSFTIPLL